MLSLRSSIGHIAALTGAAIAPALANRTYPPLMAPMRRLAPTAITLATALTLALMLAVAGPLLTNTGRAGVTPPVPQAPQRPLNLQFSVALSSGPHPVVSGRTNLPNGTELLVSVKPLRQPDAAGPFGGLHRGTYALFVNGPSQMGPNVVANLVPGMPRVVEYRATMSVPCEVPA